MQYPNRIKLAVFSSFLFLSATSWGSEDQAWQLERLNSPSDQQLISEQSSVFIYDGLYSHQIHAAMDSQFNRIGSMMFIREKIVRDGVEERLDDDCGD